jgi:hypothetical protein
VVGIVWQAAGLGRAGTISCRLRDVMPVRAAALPIQDCKVFRQLPGRRRAAIGTTVRLAKHAGAWPMAAEVNAAEPARRPPAVLDALRSYSRMGEPGAGTAYLPGRRTVYGRHPAGRVDVLGTVHFVLIQSIGLESSRRRICFAGRSADGDRLDVSACVGKLYSSRWSSPETSVNPSLAPKRP